MVLTGAYSVPEALEVLNTQWGFRTRKTARGGGKPLSRSAFYSMLINPFYTGMMEHDGQLYEGKHPPMLTQREFEEYSAQAAAPEHTATTAAGIRFHGTNALRVMRLPHHSGA